MAKWETEESLIHHDDLGSVRISPDVIETIAIEAIKRFSELSPVGWYRSTISGFLGYDRGVMLHEEDGQLILDVIIDAYYRPDIPQTIIKLQQYLYEQIQEMTEIALDEIRIYVADLVVDSAS